MDGTDDRPRRGWLRRSLAPRSTRRAASRAPSCRTPPLRGADSPLRRARIADERRRLAAALAAQERGARDGEAIGALRRSLAALRLELCGTH